jgi:hypothetical protein
MPKVLCFDCGSSFEVDYGTLEPTKQCSKCKIKLWETQVDFE